ncbi:unnamed protein product [Lampetra fluviatilis]
MNLGTRLARGAARLAARDEGLGELTLALNAQRARDVQNGRDTRSWSRAPCGRRRHWQRADPDRGPAELEQGRRVPAFLLLPMSRVSRVLHPSSGLRPAPRAVLPT